MEVALCSEFPRIPKLRPFSDKAFSARPPSMPLAPETLSSKTQAYFDQWNHTNLNNFYLTEETHEPNVHQQTNTDFVYVQCCLQVRAPLYFWIRALNQRGPLGLISLHSFLSGQGCSLWIPSLEQGSSGHEQAKLERALADPGWHDRSGLCQQLALSHTFPEDRTAKEYFFPVQHFSIHEVFYRSLHLISPPSKDSKQLRTTQGEHRMCITSGLARETI